MPVDAAALCSWDSLQGVTYDVNCWLPAAGTRTSFTQCLEGTVYCPRRMIVIYLPKFSGVLSSLPESIKDLCPVKILFKVSLLITFDLTTLLAHVVVTTSNVQPLLWSPLQSQFLNCLILFIKLTCVQWRRLANEAEKSSQKKWKLCIYPFMGTFL